MARLSSVKPRLGTLRPRLAQRDDARAEMDRRRELRPWRKWYKTARWAKLRWAVLVRDVFTCCRCGVIGADTSQLVADHRKPHRGDEALFWDFDNLQCLCGACHSGAKQREEQATAWE